jgi:hypothetical protein
MNLGVPLFPRAKARLIQGLSQLQGLWGTRMATARAMSNLGGFRETFSNQGIYEMIK